ncbi:hypothetical protein MesoLj113c_43820 [Mesorhizobium sp. 113-3-9]|uniref:hypothetical protein n=1 Tax=Mesorhizobium sp. 113-3-9 TaxID=2744517 RepID=UPI001925C741|nr:hypothetical protein [Mesorhizobium sp. 113-3-9]BCG88272.1 hypothetical protein MesoLj113c_43820 [Mesorhizobium sp. 113-3-9]
MAEDTYEEAEKSLTRIQNFDPQALARVDILGSEMNFLDGVDPAEKIISLFRQVPIQFLSELPKSKQSEIRQQADAAYSLFEQILNFDPKKPDAYSTRTSLIDSLKAQYDPFFNFLSPLISFTSSRLRDFGALEREARAAVQAAKDRADEATKQLEVQQQTAQRMLDDVRRVAAEQGVSQQAVYFQTEGNNHEAEATKWQWNTIYIAVGLGVYALISATVHKWSFLAPTTPYDTVQLGLSKVLIFAVIAYMLLLSARNFLAHKHNAVVNRHRYNALLTFTALADAAKGPENRDIVLTHAASCIFAPQDTGYTKGGTQPESVANVIQTLPRILSPGSPA